MPPIRSHPFDSKPTLTAKPRRDRLIGLGLLAVLMAAWAMDPGPMVSIRLRALDFAGSFRPAPQRPPTVVVVDIDDQSLGVIGQWPWPRDILGEMVRRLARDGVAVVVLDMLLAETDRTSPLQLSLAGASNTETPIALPEPSVTVAAREATRQPGDHDAALAAELGAVPAVTGAALSSVTLPVAAGPLVSRFAVRGTARLDLLPQSPGLVRPLAVLEARSQGIGVVNLFPDPDGALRTVPGAAVVGESLIPGLALEAVRLVAGAESLVLEAPPGAGPSGILVAGRLIPTDMRGRIWVDTRDPSRIPVVSADRLLAGGVGSANLAGRVAIVGASASGIAAPLRTAAGDGVSSALFQAMAVDSILDGRVLARPPGAKSIEFVVAGVIGVGLVVALPWLGLAGLGATALALVSVLPAVAVLAASVPGLLLDSSFPLLVGLSLAGCGAILRVGEQNLVRRRQAELLAQQGIYMRQVVDASFDAIITVDPAARIRTANAGAERLFGVPMDRLPGTRIDSLLTGAWADDVRYRPLGALEDPVRGRQTVQAIVSRSDGGTVPAELTVAETAADDRVFVIVLRDIGARLDAEEAARRAGDRLRDAVERITDGFALFGPDRRLVICNSRFVGMLGEAGVTARPGVRFDVMMERYAETSCAPVDAAGRADDWMRERMAAFAQATTPRVQECLDGRWFRIDERPTAEGGLVGVYTDITELKWREMEMTEAMLRAEAASLAKSAFLANMSHELRTPLNAVIGFADLMKRELFGPLGHDHYRSYVDDIIESGSNLLAMIEVILEFSRSEHTSLLDADTRSDLGEVVEAVMRDLMPAAMEKEIRVTAEVDKAIPPLTVDPAILYQILQNIVSNAIKFSNPRSLVHVRAFVDAHGCPAMAVTDHGMGIPPDLVDKVTQPFWQRQGPLVRSHGGVGLGLAIVKSHLDTLGGELLFDSRVDEGTTVTVRFPQSRIAAPS